MSIKQKKKMSIKLVELNLTYAMSSLISITMILSTFP